MTESQKNTFLLLSYWRFITSFSLFFPATDRPSYLNVWLPFLYRRKLIMLTSENHNLLYSCSCCFLLSKCLVIGKKSCNKVQILRFQGPFSSRFWRTQFFRFSEVVTVSSPKNLSFVYLSVPFKYNFINLQQLLKKDGLMAGKSNKYP